MTESTSGLGGQRTDERLMCHDVRICAEIGEGCQCPDNPIAPAMWGTPPQPNGEDHGQEDPNRDP